MTINNFDAVEIAAVKKDENGDLTAIHLSDLPEQEIFCWSVYGHIPEKGVDCVADCPTRDTAILIGTALSSYLGVDLHIFA